MKKRKERRKLRKLKLRTLLMLSITLIFNAYAWFLYVTQVTTNLQAHVESWNVSFEFDKEIVDKELEFNIEAAYPGMKQEKRTLTVKNLGDKTAVLSYKYATIRILNHEFAINDEFTNEQNIEAISSGKTVLKHVEMVEKLNNNYPFKLQVNIPQVEIPPQGTGTIEITFNWDYEGEDANVTDATDTEYGIESYKYYEEHPGMSAINAIIKLTASQKKE